MPKLYCFSMANIRYFMSLNLHLYQKTFSQISFCVLLEVDLTVEKLPHPSVSILSSFLFEYKLQTVFLMALILTSETCSLMQRCGGFCLLFTVYIFFSENKVADN